MNKIRFLFLKVSMGDKIFIARNLSLLLKSGISLTEALTILYNQFYKKGLKVIFKEIIEEVNNGQYLSVALQKFSHLFGNFFITLIHIGELSGNLIENLDYIAEELKKIQTLKKKIISYLIYPAFVIMVIFIVALVLILFVLPKILPIFESLNLELPLITKIFIKISNFFINYFFHIFIIFSLTLVLLFLSLKNRVIRFFYQTLIMGIPFLGTMVKKYVLLEFSRNLASLLNSGVKIIEALKITGESLNNLVYQQKIFEMVEYAKAGHPLAEYLRKYPKLFFYDFFEMIEIGEKSGNLVNNLVYISDMYEEEIDSSLQNFVNLFEPILIIFIAMGVGFIAFAIVLPIYSLTEQLSK